MYQWDVTASQWDDPVSKRIEDQHITPLLESVKSAISAMETMGESVAKSINDCS